MKYDFNTKKLESRIQINVDCWLSPAGSKISIYKMSGKQSTTCITTAKTVGKKIEEIKTGDILLLSKVSCEVATTRGAFYTVNGSRYFDVPLEQIMGTFVNDITFDSLVMLGKNILFEKLEKRLSATLLTTESSTTIGRVLKAGPKANVKCGDIILVRDNVSTPISLSGSTYYATESKFVVGIIEDTEYLENVGIINGYVLMEPYISHNVLNSTLLETAEIDYNSLDYSDVNNRDLFKVVYADKTLNNVKIDDIILVNRDYTNYVYYNNKKYFVIDNKKWIAGKIIERDKK